MPFPYILQYLYSILTAHLHRTFSIPFTTHLRLFAARLQYLNVTWFTFTKPGAHDVVHLKHHGSSTIRTAKPKLKHRYTHRTDHDLQYIICSRSYMCRHEMWYDSRIIQISPDKHVLQSQPCLACLIRRTLSRSVRSYHIK